jgi:hypothetical protein
MTDETATKADGIAAKTKLALRWLCLGLALMVFSCMATVLSPVIQGALLLAAAASIAVGIRQVWDANQTATGKTP